MLSLASVAHPNECVVRIAGTVRVDEEQFEQRLRSGALFQPRGRKPAVPTKPENKPRASVIADDSFTTVVKGVLRNDSARFS